MLPPYCALACALPSLAKGNRNGFLCLTRLYQRGMSKCVEAQTLISTQQIIWSVSVGLFCLWVDILSLYF